MFKTVGKVNCKITNATIEDAKFPIRNGEVDPAGKPAVVFFDLVLSLTDADGNITEWRGEFSTRSGIGNNAMRCRWELTIDTLQKLGINVQAPEDFYGCVYNGETPDFCIGFDCVATTDAKHIVSTDGSEKDIIIVKYLNPATSRPVQDSKKNDFLKFLQGRKQNVQQGSLQSFGNNGAKRAWNSQNNSNVPF